MLLPFFACIAALHSQSDEPPPAPREFRAAWIATVDNIDWPSKRTLTTDAQKKELIALLDKAQALRMNAVVFQVRPSCDALYASQLEPWSEYLTSIQGQPPKPYYDPLEFAVSEAHKRGLELHAWFNPYRAWHPAGKSAPAPNHISQTHPELVKKYSNFEWLDPGEPEVQAYSLNVILDVVKRYDIDGVHIDDYFYPYPVKTKGVDLQFPDDESWSKYIKSGGKLKRDDWRRHNVDDFIERLYSGIKKTKRWVKFGISPFGIYRPGVPEGIKAGIDQYAELYADAKKWLNKGWCDYFTPQLYWAIAQTPQSYPKLMNWWVTQNTQHRNLWIGNMSSNLSGKWQPQEILDQIDMTRKKEGASGNVFFSMKAFTDDYKGIDEKLLAGPYAKSALIPSCPWLDRSVPRQPKIEVKSLNKSLIVVFDKPSGNQWQWACYAKLNKGWIFAGVLPREAPWWLIDTATVQAVAVSAVDRYGNEGRRSVIELAPQPSRSAGRP